MKKKWMAGALAGVLVLTSAPAAAGLGEALPGIGNVFVTDVYAAATGQETAVSVLSLLGVLSGDGSGQINASTTLSRAEFAKMLVDCSAYKNLVTKGVASSLYRDVSSSNWAASYIKVAVENGLMSGYSDGSFRPEESVTYEQALNSILKLLGYTDDDFTGAFPYAQINMAQSLGLADGVSLSAGSALTKGEGAVLLYNALNTYIKDSTTTKYAQQLGYEVNSDGSIDYASVLSESMTGPVTVKSSAWYSELGLTDSVTVYKNGALSSKEDVNVYDIVYYSTSMNRAWVYSDRVSGVYDRAEPNQDAPTSIVLSGTTYELEGNAAFTALSSAGSLKPGDTITLLLGKDGRVADAVSSTADAGEIMILYVVATGEKDYTDSTGATNSMYYIQGVSPSGSSYEYAIEEDWIDVGDVVSLTFDEDEDDGIRVRSASSSSVSGTVSAQYLTIGNTRVASDVVILDTKEGSYTRTSLSRLDGIDLSSSDVLYSKGENGEITQLILDNVTGDCASYGVVLSTSSQSSGMNISGSYTFIADGKTQTVNTQGKAFSGKKGPAVFDYKNGELSSIQNLTAVSGSASKIEDSYAVIRDKTYPYAADVSVFVYENGDYKISTVQQMQKSGNATFYCDKDPDRGGRVRVIVYEKD